MANFLNHELLRFNVEIALLPILYKGMQKKS